MARVMPSRVAQTIDELFPNESKSRFLNADHSPQLLGILNLLNDVPDELIILPSADYSELVLAKSTIERYLAIWGARNNIGYRDCGGQRRASKFIEEMQIEL